MLMFGNIPMRMGNEPIANDPGCKMQNDSDVGFCLMALSCSRMLRQNKLDAPYHQDIEQRDRGVYVRCKRRMLIFQRIFCLAGNQCSLIPGGDEGREGPTRAPHRTHTHAALVLVCSCSWHIKNNKQ